MEPHGRARTGEPGEAAITGLFNYGTLLLRYVDGDLVAAVSRLCSCGRGLPLLSRVDGRIIGTVRTIDGHCLRGGFFPHLLGGAFPVSIIPRLSREGLISSI